MKTDGAGPGWHWQFNRATKMAAKTALDMGQQKRTINTSARPANSPNFTGPTLAPRLPANDGVSGPKTMSSVELLGLVNVARESFGESEVRRNDFTDRCKNELAGDDYETFVVCNPNGTESEAINMTRDQCMYVLMRESKAVRRTVTAKLNDRPVALPNFADPVIAARAWADAVEGRQQAHIERDRAIATKAEIGARREATAMARASTAVREANRLKAELGRSQTHATVLAVERASRRSFGRQGWRLLRKWCDDHGLTPESVHDPRYGTVKAWPADAWGSVYSIDLCELFPAAE